jgi:hypothetical protein
VVPKELDLLRHRGLPHDFRGIGLDAIVVLITPGATTLLEEGFVDQWERCGHSR